MVYISNSEKRTMITYQDYERIRDSGNVKEVMVFVKSAIESYKDSTEFKIATTASLYDKQQNEFMRSYQKRIVLETGESIEDVFSPNHKVCSNFYHQFTNNLAYYLLGNGVTFEKEDTKEKLGEDFDEKIVELAKKAMHGKRAFGFYNIDPETNKPTVEVFSNYSSSDNAVFIALDDEETGKTRAGIRFWQIDDFKPLFATIYDEEYYSTFVFRTGREPEILVDKSPYIKNHYRIYGETGFTNGKKQSGIPIFTMWGNGEHTSEIEGMKETIDLYDLTLNANGNDLDSALLYWLVHGADGMNQREMVQFLKKMQSQRIASVDNDRAIEPVTVSPPTEARERLLALLERRMYDDFGMLDTTTLSAGNLTATQIIAAYEKMDLKATGLELQVTKFIMQLLNYLGIEDKPTYTRSRLTNRLETVQIVKMASDLLTEDYQTRKILEMLDDGDKAEKIVEEKKAETESGEISRFVNETQPAENSDISQGDEE